MVATPELIDQDKQRLESLGLFSRVELYPGTIGNEQALIVEVTELWYIWPGIYLEIDEEEIENLQRTAYGGHINHDNFRGRREHLSLIGFTGYRRGGQARWKIPYLFSTREWGMNVEMKWMEEDEPGILAEREDITSLSRSLRASLGRRLNLESSYSISSSIEERQFYERNVENGSEYVEPDTDNDILFELTGGYHYDTRYYNPWPTQGVNLDISFSVSNSLNSGDVLYVRPLLSLSAYKLVAPRIYLAGRIYSLATFGSSPVFRRYIINRLKSVRTSAERSLEGDRALLLQSEVRYDIIDRTYLTLWAPWKLQRYTRNLKFGVSVATFVDYGVVDGVHGIYDPANKPDRYYAGWEAAYGAALVFHVPYRDIIRFEVSRSARFPDSGYLFKLRIGPAF